MFGVTFMTRNISEFMKNLCINIMGRTNKFSVDDLLCKYIFLIYFICGNEIIFIFKLVLILSVVLKDHAENKLSWHWQNK